MGSRPRQGRPAALSGSDQRQQSVAGRGSQTRWHGCMPWLQAISDALHELPPGSDTDAVRSQVWGPSRAGASAWRDQVLQPGGAVAPPVLPASALPAPLHWAPMLRWRSLQVWEGKVGDEQWEADLQLLNQVRAEPGGAEPAGRWHWLLENRQLQMPRVALPPALPLDAAVSCCGHLHELQLQPCTPRHPRHDVPACTCLRWSATKATLSFIR